VFGIGCARSFKRHMFNSSSQCGGNEDSGGLGRKRGTFALRFYLEGRRRCPAVFLNSRLYTRQNLPVVGSASHQAFASTGNSNPRREPRLVILRYQHKVDSAPTVLPSRPFTQVRMRDWRLWRQVFRTVRLDPDEAMKESKVCLGMCCG
jgi:hypothetical protein